MHIPAQSGSEISVFRDIYADIGDEQSIEQSLSTFSGHINNIIRILEVANQNSLVILDELGAGTDPQEGAALARALLTSLLERGITTLVTTHHPELKAFAHTTAGVVNASAEFDLDTLRPTYHLTIGLPGRSNALAIAQRLGMPDDIINKARSELSPEDLKAEGLLDEIHRQRDLARQARTAAEANRQESDKLVSDLAERLESIEDERRAVLEQARAEAEEELEELRSEMRQVRRALAQARQPLEILDAAEEQVEILEEAVEVPVIRQNPEIGGKPLHRAVRLGDKVLLRSLDTHGVVTTLGEEEAEVQVGMLRIRARLTDLQSLSEVHQTTSDDDSKTTMGQTKQRDGIVKGPATGFPPSPGLEIDLRGKRADEAIDALDAYLDSAYLAGLPFVRIIHGKGTGKLRRVVREALQGHPHVNSFEAGGDKEGGEGVTVAKLRE
jgi:DNA mismatch repair protein MutS2